MNAANDNIEFVFRPIYTREMVNGMAAWLVSNGRAIEDAGRWAVEAYEASGYTFVEDDA
jgi:hypothetical protein